MKREIYKWAIVLACVFKIVKTVTGFVSEMPYAIKDMVTFLLSSAVIIAFLFIKSDKLFKFAIIGLLISNMIEYVVVFLPVTRVALGFVNLLLLLLTLYFAIKSARGIHVR